jgi:hypothetical protein
VVVLAAAEDIERLTECFRNSRSDDAATRPVQEHSVPSFEHQLSDSSQESMTDELGLKRWRSARIPGGSDLDYRYLEGLPGWNASEFVILNLLLRRRLEFLFVSLAILRSVSACWYIQARILKQVSSIWPGSFSPTRFRASRSHVAAAPFDIHGVAVRKERADDPLTSLQEMHYTFPVLLFDFL